MNERSDMKELDHLNPEMELSRVIRLTPGNLVITPTIDKVVYRLAPGRYETNGVSLPETCSLIADEPGSVYIDLLPREPSNFHVPQMLYRNSHMMLFYAFGLTLNCNWKLWENKRRATNGNFKLGAFALRCWQGKVERCAVVDFGADGKNGDEYNEVFPLRLDTYRGEKESENLPIPCVEIAHCRVEKPHFVSGGYCTAIFSQTNQGTQNGDRFPIGTRTSQAAHIHDNIIEVPGGIGLGCADAERTLFESNQVVNSKCAFNFDTGSLYSSAIEANRIVNCAEGINLSGASNGVAIRRNTIDIGDPFINTVVPGISLQFAVRLENNAKTVVEANVIKTNSPRPNELMLGQFTGDNQFEPRTQPPAVESPSEPRILDLESRLKAVIEELEDALRANKALKDRLAAADRQIESYRTLNSELQQSVKGLADAKSDLDSTLNAVKAKIAAIEATIHSANS